MEGEILVNDKKLSNLCNLRKMINSGNYDVNSISTLYSNYLNNLIDDYELNNELVKLSGDNIDDWREVIKNKPIYEGLSKVISGKYNDPIEVSKIASSLLTQIIIRKLANPSINLELLGYYKICDLLSKLPKFDIDQFKEIIKSYDLIK